MMNITSSPQQQPVSLSNDEIILSSSTSSVTLSSSPPPLPTPTFPSVSLNPRSSIVDHRMKSRPGAAGVDIDPNKLFTIKRSQAISNIQDLDEDSPVTFEPEPNEHLYGRKKVQLLANVISRSKDESSISSFDKHCTNSSGNGDESDTRSECSEKMPEYLDEEKPILPGIHVKGATLNRLIRVLIDSFRKFRSTNEFSSIVYVELESNGTVIDEDSEYPKVFFLMHKWIMESEYLSHIFYDLYKHANDDYKKAQHQNEKHFSKEYQLRICHAYQYVYHWKLSRSRSSSSS